MEYMTGLYIQFLSVAYDTTEEIKRIATGVDI